MNYIKDILNLNESEVKEIRHKFFDIFNGGDKEIEHGINRRDLEEQ